MANTFNKMLSANVMKRADSMKIRYKEIHVEKGFNGKNTDPADFEAAVESMYEHIKQGGKYPALEVRPREEGGAWLVDGHTRHAAIGRAIKKGLPIKDPKDGEVWVSVTEFTGNDAERVARILTSAEGSKPTTLETANIYKRLIAFGWSAEDIAKKVGKSGEHVRGLLKLGNANTDVQDLVKSKKISASAAVNVVKQHGEGAGKVIKAAVKVAAKAGKKKVTTKALDVDKRKVAADEKKRLEEDAYLFRWLEMHGQVGVGLMGGVEITFEIDATGFNDMREAVQHGIVKSQKDAA